METIWLHTAGVNNSQEIFKDLMNFQTYDNGEQKYSCLFLKGVFAKNERGYRLNAINFLLIDATDRSKISSDQKRFFIALSLYPLSFSSNTPLKNEQGFPTLQLKAIISKQLR